jgi:hypothetical protein
MKNCTVLIGIFDVVKHIDYDIHIRLKIMNDIQMFRADVKKPPIVCPKIRQLGRGGVLENPVNGKLTPHHPSPWPAVWLAMTSKGVGDQPPGRGRLRLPRFIV